MKILEEESHKMEKAQDDNKSKRIGLRQRGECCDQEKEEKLSLDEEKKDKQ